MERFLIRIKQSGKLFKHFVTRHRPEFSDSDPHLFHFEGEARATADDLKTIYPCDTFEIVLVTIGEALL